MKTKLLHSVLSASLLLSSASFAASIDDGITTLKETPSQKRAAQAQVEVTNSSEAYLAKVKAGSFTKEANADETKRLNKILNNTTNKHQSSLQKAPKEFMEGLNDTCQPRS